MGMSPQQPFHRAAQRDPEQGEKRVDEGFPAIRALAKREKAEIFFGDEGDIRSDYHSGTTSSAKGQTPVAEKAGARFSLNMILAIFATGQIRFMTVEGTVFHGALGRGYPDYELFGRWARNDEALLVSRLNSQFAQPHAQRAAAARRKDPPAARRRDSTHQRPRA